MLVVVGRLGSRRRRGGGPLDGLQMVQVVRSVRGRRLLLGATLLLLLHTGLLTRLLLLLAGLLARLDLTLLLLTLLLLLLAGNTVLLSLDIHRSHGLHGSGVVGRVVQHGLDVSHKQGEEQIDDLLLVGKLEGSIIRDPHALEMHGAGLDHMTQLLSLENTVSSASGHAGHVEELGTVDHVVVLSTRHADASGLDLETQCSLVLP